jgi:hypothetical protein
LIHVQSYPLGSIFHGLALYNIAGQASVASATTPILLNQDTCQVNAKE